MLVQSNSAFSFQESSCRAAIVVGESEFAPGTVLEKYTTAGIVWEM